MFPRCLAWDSSCWHACEREGRGTGAGSQSEVAQLSPMGKAAAGSADVLQEPAGWEKLSQLSGTDHEPQLYSNIWFLAQIFVAEVFQRGRERAARGCCPRGCTRPRAEPPCLQYPCAAPKCAGNRQIPRDAPLQLPGCQQAVLRDGLSWGWCPHLCI